MSQPGDSQPMMDSNTPVPAVTISSEVMVAAVIFLFMVVVFVFFLYLYAKHFMGANPSLRRAGARLIFATSNQISLPRRGLEPELLQSLPIAVYNPSDFKEGLECAVCLSELSEGEKARILPKCNHGFHLECIDMWFHSHSTCPLCRSAVSGTESVESPPLETVSGDGSSAESLVFPTNVLFWGSQDRVSNVSLTTRERSSTSGSLIIEIPTRFADGFPPTSPLPSSRFPGEEMKSPAEEVKSPKSARLRSLRRLLSGGKRPISSSYSPRGGDIEQGLVGASGEGSSLVPKTPKSSTS